MCSINTLQRWSFVELCALYFIAMACIGNGVSLQWLGWYVPMHLLTNWSLYTIHLNGRLIFISFAAHTSARAFAYGKSYAIESKDQFWFGMETNSISIVFTRSFDILVNYHEWTIFVFLNQNQFGWVLNLFSFVICFSLPGETTFGQKHQWFFSFVSRKIVSRQKGWAHIRVDSSSICGNEWNLFHSDIPICFRATHSRLLKCLLAMANQPVSMILLMSMSPLLLSFLLIIGGCCRKCFGCLYSLWSIRSFDVIRGAMAAAAASSSCV